MAPREFAIDPEHPDMTSVVVATVFRQGQGAHGASPLDTLNNMAAIGPDFKKRFVGRRATSATWILPNARARDGRHAAASACCGTGDLEALSGGRAAGFRSAGCFRRTRRLRKRDDSQVQQIGFAAVRRRGLSRTNGLRGLGRGVVWPFASATPYRSRASRGDARRGR